MKATRIGVAALLCASLGVTSCFVVEDGTTSPTELTENLLAGFRYTLTVEEQSRMAPEGVDPNLIEYLGLESWFAQHTLKAAFIPANVEVLKDLKWTGEAYQAELEEGDIRRMYADEPDPKDEKGEAKRANIDDGKIVVTVGGRATATNKNTGNPWSRKIQLKYTAPLLVDRTGPNLFAVGPLVVTVLQGTGLSTYPAKARAEVRNRIREFLDQVEARFEAKWPDVFDRSVNPAGGRGKMLFVDRGSDHEYEPNPTPPPDLRLVKLDDAHWIIFTASDKPHSP